LQGAVLPLSGDRVLCFSEGQILLSRSETEVLTVPAVEDLTEGKLQYLFRMEGENFFLWMGSAPQAKAPWHYEPVRTLRQMTSKDVCYAVMTGWHLYNWYRNNRFCGRCTGETVHDEAERMLRCPNCGNMIFPRISPAVIVAVTDGDRLLLTKYAGRNYTRYALIAGYTEIGETIEQTVSREVKEEVGLQVKNLRYYKSQPWGVDGNVLMGFYCDLDGSDAVCLDTNELSVAQWFPRDEIPAKDDGISLTREMIRVFSEGKEPR
jgi:NAD+ diphosphatase